MGWGGYVQTFASVYLLGSRDGAKGMQAAFIGGEAALKRSILLEEQYSVQTGSLDFDPGYDPTERKRQLLFYLC